MRRRIWIGFLVTEAALYAAFLMMDLLQLGSSDALKFIAISLVALMAVCFVKDRLIVAALCLTAAADVFLLLLDRYYTAGILLFCGVQICYALYLDGGKGLPLRLIPAVAAGLIGCCAGWLSGLSVGYITLFFCNLLRAAISAKQNPLFALGLLLFFCCDLCVGYYNIGSGAMWDFARVAMWGFYLPGQVLILASARMTGGTNE